MTKVLSNDDFFLKLSELFEDRRRKDHGSIYLTQKRVTYEESPELLPKPTTDNPFPDLNLSRHLPILIRATDGKEKLQKTKLSTLVEPDALDAFFVRYADVCKAGMSGLKKRDRSKLKAKMKAKKKKGGVAADEAAKV